MQQEETYGGGDTKAETGDESSLIPKTCVKFSVSGVETLPPAGATAAGVDPATDEVPLLAVGDPMEGAAAPDTAGGGPGIEGKGKS